MNPRPSLAELAEFYQNYVKDRAPRRPSPWRDPMRQVSTMVSMRNGADGAFLDIGCGAGSACLVAHELGLTVSALEVDETAITSALTVPGLNLHRCLFEEFEAGGEKFDFILASQVLEHAHDPRGFVEKCAGILNPQGVICIALPSFQSMLRLARGIRDPYFIPPAHLNHFSRRSLSTLFARSGLRAGKWLELSHLPVEKLAKRYSPTVWLRPAARLAFTVVSLSLHVLGAATHSGIMLEGYFRNE